MTTDSRIVYRNEGRTPDMPPGRVGWTAECRHPPCGGWLVWERTKDKARKRVADHKCKSAKTDD
jgi:hypothetical protein